ncbi:hypothetical protein FORMB_17950 [Formosa sp. Hel1_33_131]|nr:hypothetical protein FORMB_17950 [Formosa sp. Hel1_33_131]
MIIIEGELQWLPFFYYIYSRIKTPNVFLHDQWYESKFKLPFLEGL